MFTTVAVLFVLLVAVASAAAVAGAPALGPLLAASAGVAVVIGVAARNRQ